MNGWPGNHVEMKTDRLLREYFCRLENLPCWGFQQGWGSFLNFNFGQPYLRISEGNPAAKRPRNRRRRVFVLGQHHISVQQCEWRVLKNGKELAWSESERSVIARALVEMDGQFLIEVDFDFRNGTARFAFEGGVSLDVRRYVDFEYDDSVWTLFSGQYAISQLADGRLEFGLARQASRVTVPESFHLNLST